MSLKSKATWVAFAIAALLATIALVRVSSVREPEYQGKKLNEWMDELGRGRGNTNEAAAIAIRRMGTNCLPFLLVQIQKVDSPIRAKLLDFLSPLRSWKRVGLRLPDRDYSQRSLAVLAFSMLGPQAESAVPKLAELLNGRAQTAHATQALIVIGPSGLPPVVKALEAENQETRKAVIAGLWALPTPSQPMKGFVFQNLETEYAQAVLDTMIPPILANLRNSNWEVRLAVISTLRHIGDRRTVPRLVEALNDRNLSVRTGAMNSLRTIDPEAAAKAGVK